MEKVISMKDIKKGKKPNSIKWAITDYKKNSNGDLEEYPLKVYQNIEVLLHKYGYEVKYNEVTKKIEFNTNDNTDKENNKRNKLYFNQIEDGLKMNKDDVYSSIDLIADKNIYNPFSDLVIKNINTDTKLIKRVFSCLSIKEGYTKEQYQFYYTLFLKWAIGVVRMNFNTLKLGYKSQGILVLQGKQGTFKSTFSNMLMPIYSLFQGEKSINPNNKDSLIQSTGYTLVELGELDSTLKGDQATLKAFITSASDEYRAAYQRVAEIHPRKTSYIATVNKTDFLKDETGSRRFWVIPVESIDIEKMKTIDMNMFWGCIYDMWKSEKEKYYLTPEENELLNELNKSYNAETDISIQLDEAIDWESEELVVFQVIDLCNNLNISDKKALKNEMLRRGIEYKAHRVGGVIKKGYKIPRIKVERYRGI